MSNTLEKLMLSAVLLAAVLWFLLTGRPTGIWWTINVAALMLDFTAIVIAAFILIWKGKI